jgi:hypothetical protein
MRNPVMLSPGWYRVPLELVTEGWSKAAYWLRRMYDPRLQMISDRGWCCWIEHSNLLVALLNILEIRTSNSDTVTCPDEFNTLGFTSSSYNSPCNRCLFESKERIFCETKCVITRENMDADVQNTSPKAQSRDRLSIIALTARKSDWFKWWPLILSEGKMTPNRM